MNRVDELYRQRPRNRFVRATLYAFTALITGSWFIGSASGAWSVGDLFSSRRMENLRRFWNTEALPQLGEQPLFADYAQWGKQLWLEQGAQATTATLAMAVAAIVIAAAGAALVVLPAARNLATAEPLVPDGQAAARWRQRGWRLLSESTRLALVFLRAIPEYIWAFLLITLLGTNAWPAVLALAIHNCGILGKLGAEVIENHDSATPRALRGLGATRRQVLAFGIVPLALPRWLLYFFYRWETCVREATVLGMLGVSSLGYFINEARARDRYDEMLFLMLLGAVLVLAGDGVSALARLALRRAG